MFSRFIPAGSVKRRFILKEEGEGEGDGGSPPDGGIRDDLDTLKGIMGSQFEALVLEIQSIHGHLEETIEIPAAVKEIKEALGRLGERVDKLEALTESTIDELVESYTAILENLEGDAEEVVGDIVGKIGVAAGRGLVKKMDVVISGSGCDPAVKARVAEVRAALSELG
jgi:hypothetical protein